MKPSRRQLLVTGAALLAASRAQAQVARPKRFITVYFPNGVVPNEWFPTGGEADFQLGASHAALAPFRDDCLWLQGVDLKVAVFGQGEAHQRGIGAFLTGQELQAGKFRGFDGQMAGWANGASLDQLLIPVLGAGAAAGSLQLGVRCLERDVRGALSYSAAARPLLAVNDPVQTFRLLFGPVPGPPDEVERRRRRHASILDAVRAEFPLASEGLRAADTQVLDRHLDEVRALEKRVTALPPATQCISDVPPATAFTQAAAMPQIAKLQIDLLVKGLECDLTRIATLSLGDARNQTPLPFLGIDADMHQVTHLPDSDPGRAQLATRDRWATEQCAYLLQRLKETGLLDDTLVLFGTELCRGNMHSHLDVPVVLAGHGAGFRMGRFVQHTNASWNDLLLSIFRAFGGASDVFGAAQFCSGPLARLT